MSAWFDNIEQSLVEAIADFIDHEDVVLDEIIAGFKDPQPRGETDLHERMAKAAMEVYKNTMVKCPQ